MWEDAGSPGTARKTPPTSWEELAARIGGTPLAPVEVRLGRRRWTLLLKLEGHNPIGSIKDRTAVGLLRSLEARHPGEGALTVVESTSGNLGAALAAMCRLRGHSFIAVVDPNVSAENLGWMERFGARIEMADRADESGSYLADRIELVRRICRTEPNVHWTDQYSNPANPRIHFRQTGPEIVRQAGHDMDCVFAAVSTGGTLAGITRYVRAASRAAAARGGPGVKVIGVDAVGSLALGGRPGLRRLTGHGASCRSDFVDIEDLDEIRWIGDADTIAMCHKLTTEAGLCLGGSSGAVVAACVQYLIRHPDTRKPVCVCPDGGFKYRESIYHDAWVRDREIAVDDALARYEELGLRFSVPAPPSPKDRRC
jgi:2,3-diaminopropionate biosynthesis protein SbnA